MITYLIETMWLVWLIVCISCLVIELCSGDLFIICFAFGAIVPMICAMAGAPIWLQVLLWAVASVLCILFVRPSLLKKLHARKERLSNADAMIGQQGRVTTAIPVGGYGYVKIAGDEWRAVTKGDAEIAVGTTVRVISRESTIITVE
ncbi:MAG: NfeD family protein [Prevotella sp.]|nr:NfeD family protein [Prevotella sp.]